MGRFNIKPRSKPVAYALWLLSIFGWLGFHRFYLGKKTTGLIWIFTGGVLGIGSLFDLCSLGEQVNRINRVAVLKRMADGMEVPELKSFDEMLNNQGSRTVHFCPYCKMGLKHILTYQMKCPYCKREIKIRFKQTLFSAVLLNKEEAAIVDHFYIMRRFHISEQDFNELKNEMSKRYHEEIFVIDVFWQLFLRVISNIKDIKVLRSVLHSFALFLKDAGVNQYTVLQRAARIRLFELKRDYEKVRIIPFGITESCPACKRRQGEILTIAEALAEMPVPCKSCIYKLGGLIPGFCRCSYEAVDE